MLSPAFTIAVCIYPNAFRFLSDAPYEALWRAAAICAAIFALLALALLARQGGRRSPGRHGLGVAVTAALALAALAVFAGRHAVLGLACAAVPPIPGRPEGVSPALAQRIADDTRNLTILPLLLVGMCLIAGALLLAAYAHGRRGLA